MDGGMGCRGRDGGMAEEEQEEEQRGCGWGWAAWLTGLDLAGWLAVTHNLRRGFSPGLIRTRAHTHTHAVHHVSMGETIWKWTTVYTHVFTNMSQHTLTHILFTGDCTLNYFKRQSVYLQF